MKPTTKPAIRITIICAIIALGCVPGLFRIASAQSEPEPYAPYTLYIEGDREDAEAPPVVTLEADYYRVTWTKPDGAEWQCVTRGMLEQARETSKQKDADLSAMCDEVARCYEWIEGTVEAELVEVGIYRDDPQTATKFKDCMQRQVIALRPPRVTAILAQRKEQQP